MVLIRRFTTSARLWKQEFDIDKCVERITRNLAYRDDFPYLFDAYDTIIQRHRSWNINKYPVKETTIFLENLETDDTKDQRRKIINTLNYRAPSATYINFLKTLYPSKLHTSLHLGQQPSPNSHGPIENMLKYQNINHDLLYQRFCSLPRPAFLHMRPQHAEDFLSKFLTRRDFTKPSLLSSSSTLGPIATIRAYQELIEKRTEYVDMCSHVFQDLRDSGLPTTSSERNKLFYYLYHKDRHDVLKLVDKAVSLCDSDTPLLNFTPRKFDWSAYKTFINQFELDEDTANMLLSLAIRHKQPAIVSDILDKVGIDSERTASLVLDAQLNPYWSKNLPQTTIPALEYCSRTHLDISTVNKIIKYLLHRGHIRLAEKILKHFNPKESLATNKHLITYKQLTPEDVQLYETTLKSYDEFLRLNDQKRDYKLFPTEDTFLPLIEFYSSQHQFDHALRLMDVMEMGFGLPLTTRIFRAVVEIFKHISIEQGSNYSLEKFRYLLARILLCHSYSYRVVDDTTYGSLTSDLTVPPSLEPYLSPFLNNAEPALPYNRGTFLKLKDDLMSSIFMAAIHVINDSSLAHQISELHILLKKTVADLRKSNDRRLDSAKAVYINDGVTYAKREALFELMEMIV